MQDTSLQSLEIDLHAVQKTQDKVRIFHVVGHISSRDIWDQ